MWYQAVWDVVPTGLLVYRLIDKTECYVESLRVEDQQLRLISLVGTTVAVRGVWARLMENRRDTYTLRLDGYDSSADWREGHVSVMVPRGEMVTLREALGPHTTHLVAFTAYLCRDASILSDALYSFRSDLFPTVDLLSPVPMRSEWGEWLVREGEVAGLIKSIDGFGKEVFRVHRDGWEELIRRGLSEGVLR